MQNIRTFSRNGKLVARRRAHIAKCAAKLIIKNGYDNTTTRQIAEACSMSTGALYHYVESKKDVLLLVIDYGINIATGLVKKAVKKRAKGSATQTLRDTIRILFELVDRLQDITMLCYKEMDKLEPNDMQHLNIVHLQVIEMIKALLEQGRANGEFKIDDVTLAAFSIEMLGDMWALKRWFLRRHYTLEQYVEMQTEFILEAIGATKLGKPSLLSN